MIESSNTSTSAAATGSRSAGVDQLQGAQVALGVGLPARHVLGRHDHVEQLGAAPLATSTAAISCAGRARRDRHRHPGRHLAHEPCRLGAHRRGDRDLLEVELGPALDQALGRAPSLVGLEARRACARRSRGRSSRRTRRSRAASETSMPISENIRAKIRASTGSSSEIVPLKSNSTARGGVSSATGSTIRHRHRDAPHPPHRPLAGARATTPRSLRAAGGVPGRVRIRGHARRIADAGTMVADLYLGYGLAATLAGVTTAQPPEPCPLPGLACHIHAALAGSRSRRARVGRDVPADLVAGRVPRGDRGRAGRHRPRRRLPGEPRAAPAGRRSRAIRAALLPRLAPVAGAWAMDMHGDGWSVVSASPELFLRTQGRWVETMPIKGTRPAGGRRRDRRQPQGPRRAHHDRRPRAQRPRPGVRAGQRARAVADDRVADGGSAAPDLDRRGHAARRTWAWPICCARPSPAAR